MKAGKEKDSALSTSYKQIRQYTYFDNSTKKYLEQRRKNQLKRKQNIIESERKQLARCTFQPALETNSYNHLTQKINRIRQEVSHKPSSKMTQRPQNRLLQWGNRKQIKHRNKVIQKQLDIINFTRSLSKEKLHKRFNRSLQQISRSPNQEDSFLKSVKAVPIISKEELQGGKVTYKTLQYVRKNN